MACLKIWLTETTCKSRIQDHDSRVLHSWREGYEGEGGPEKWLWDSQNSFKAGSPKSKDYTWNVYPECELTATD